MFDVRSLEDVRLMRESSTVEFKLAGGKDGLGALPEDFWKTYSAFANTNGGIVVLGIRERRNEFQIAGIPNIAKVRSELFSGANNRKIVSGNLLRDELVNELDIDGAKVLVVEVPRAARTSQPVHLTGNPLSGNTYIRRNEGDFSLSDEAVKRMLAEQVEDSRDDRILVGYDWSDVFEETFRAYRQVFVNREPEHPFNALNDLEFLRSIGGFRKDRETGVSGLTAAGVLMFGNMVSIQEAFPNYMLDFQERPEAKTERRWIDRLTLDGKWSGNLYDFYRRVYLKLTADLKVPFVLEHGERQDETPVHVALREALANVLVHADYTDRASVLVVKRPDMFGFRNPGTMRIPVEIALQGGEADCRNRTWHKMFRFVGVGEQAGTGIPKIVQGWKSQHWNVPKLHESREPFNQTLLELRMIDLFPAGVMQELQRRCGDDFSTLSQSERIALAIASIEGVVNHGRLCAVTEEHPIEVSRNLQHLTQKGFLSSSGGRGAVYHLPWREVPTPDDVFGPLPQSAPQTLAGPLGALNLGSSSQGSGRSSQVSKVGQGENLSGRAPAGYIISDQLVFPLIDTLSFLQADIRAELEGLAEIPRTKGRVGKPEMEQILLSICSQYYLTLNCLAELLARRPESLRNEYLTRMVKERKLALAFPTRPIHERQAYCSAEALHSLDADVNGRVT